MINLVRAESYRLTRSWVFRSAVPVAIACAAATAILAWVTYSRAGESGGYTSYVPAFLNETMVTVFLGSLLATVIVTQDHEAGIARTLRMTFTTAEIVAAKATVFAAGISLLLLPYAVLGLVGLFPVGEFLEHSSSPLMSTARDWTAIPSGDRTARTVVVIVTTAANLIAQVSICLPLGVWLRHSLPTAVLGIGGVMVLQVLANSFDRTAYLGALWQLSPYSWTQGLGLPFTEKEMMASISTSVFFLGAMVVLAWFIARSRDVE